MIIVEFSARHAEAYHLEVFQSVTFSGTAHFVNKTRVHKTTFDRIKAQLDALSVNWSPTEQFHILKGV